jgi:SAM-dependent methyltransferase
MVEATSRATFRLSSVQRAHRTNLLTKLATGEYHLEDVPACPCGSTDATPLASHDRFGLPIGVVLCRSCGLARSTPRLSTADLPDFYQNIYHGLHMSLPAPDPSTTLFRRGQGAAIFALLRDQLPNGPLLVAEIGAATGQVLREFAEAAGKDVRTAGCEYASAYVEAGRSVGTDMRRGGPETLQDLAPFDVVILSHVVEHLPDLTAGLADVRALGDEATLFFVEVPGLLTIDRKREYAFRFDRYLTAAHTFHFTLRTLTETMARSGFRLISGDEEIRSIFSQGERQEPKPDAANARAVMNGLRALESWSNRMRQAKLFLALRSRGVWRRLKLLGNGRIREAVS